MAQIQMDEIVSQTAKNDPHVFYGQLRAAEPLYYVEGLNSWLLTRYEDALFLLKDPRFIKDRRRRVVPEGQEAAEQEGGFAMRSMITSDPPDHSRLRGLVSKAFTPRMIEQLRPRIQQITDELLDAVQGQSEIDLIASFAYPLPITVISEMLGIPARDRPRFRVWTQVILNMKEESAAAIEEFLGYIKSLLAEKRVHPGNDLISSLIQVEESGDQLSEEELLGTVFLLIIAGHETTVNLIGNGTLALLQHPEQMQILRERPVLMPNAVEELLRYTSPVSLSDERWADEDILLHGKLIHKGDMIVAALLSVNADPEQFSDPTVLDVTRQENAHLAFGKGLHFCLGAPLARLEGQIAFTTLLSRLPNLRLACVPEQLVWNQNSMLRGLRSLPVSIV